MKIDLAMPVDTDMAKRAPGLQTVETGYESFADHGVFVVENLDNTDILLKKTMGNFTLYTFPLNFTGITGVPCRIMAEPWSQPKMPRMMD